MECVGVWSGGDVWWWSVVLVDEIGTESDDAGAQRDGKARWCVRIDNVTCAITTTLKRSCGHLV
jgi:hypothetical protein